MTRTQIPDATLTETLAEAHEAREDVALRLERLARRVRASTTMDMDDLAEAYTAVVKLCGVIRNLLDPNPR